MKRWLRLTLLVLAGIVAAPVLLLLAALLMLQTETGQDWLSAMLSRQLSTPGSTLTITGLRGSPPFDFSVADIRVADRDGTWLEIGKARLTIEPRTLLHGELTVRRLRAETVSLSRLPAASPSPAAPPTRQPLRLEPPRLPLAVTVDQLAVDRLSLAEPVLGQAAALTFAADARLAGGVAAAHISLRRIDNIPGTATLALSLAGAPAKLDLDAEISEPTGRLMARVLQRPDFQPLSASLKGAGPVTDWHGNLAATVGSVLQLQADLHLAQPAEYRLSLEGEARQTGLLSDKLQPMVGERVRFSARAGFGEGDRVSLDQLTLAAAAGTLSAAAALDNGTQKVSGNAKLDVPDLAVAGALAGAPLAGHLKIDAAMQGSVMEPVLKLDITGEGARYATYAIEKLEAKLNLTGRAAGPRTRWGVDAHCHVAGLGRDGQALPARLGEAIDVTLAGILDPGDRSMALDGFTVTGAGLDLAAAGHLSPDSSNGTIMLQVAELGRFGGLAGLPGLKGHVSIDANVTREAAAKVTATVHGKAEAFATGIPAADALLGSHIDLTAEAARNEDGGFVLSQLGMSATGL
ncbi:MAG: translocation and assembly module TamB, partial [Rhodospirillaceae bacterium]|nr:translocation and assembly module TamB [Rhodospirillaceae bacterium]